MEVIKYSLKNHKKIISQITEALREGKVVAYPTDTSYGLAVDISNQEALKRLYKIKERQKTQPIHILVPSISYAKEIVNWDEQIEKFANKYWPGPLTLVLKLKSREKVYKTLSGNTGFLGVRMSKSKISQDIVASLGSPITTTSANPSKHISGGKDSYSGEEVFRQFEKQKHKPDLILDAGKLVKTKPSTLVKIDGQIYEILRVGPIKETEIKKFWK